MPQDAATIHVRVGELRQLFNSMDPSPFRERDLDPDCEEFIVSWARELKPDGPLRIEVRVEREQPPEAMLAAVAPAVHTHFEREASLQNLRLRRQIRDARLSLGIGLLSLAGCIGGAALTTAHALEPFGGIVRESLLIAGWVVMWHPLEVLLYGLWPVLRERRLLERLAAADVVLHTA
jgi:hypothetical protein